MVQWWRLGQIMKAEQLLLVLNSIKDEVNISVKEWLRPAVDDVGFLYRDQKNPKFVNTAKNYYNQGVMNLTVILQGMR